MPRILRRACLIGGGLALVLVLLVGSSGRVELAAEHLNGGFYDAQARAWLDRHWDVPPDVVGSDGFQTDHGDQIYFGPFPSALRLPVLAVTNRLDGRLSQPSGALALVLTLVATSRLLWSVRRLWTSSDEVGRGVAFAHGVMVFTVGAGSTMSFLAATPIVYHEAVLWASSLALASIDHQVRLLHEPRTASVLWAGMFAGLALLSRVTMGAALLLPLVVLLAGGVVGRVRGTRGAGDERAPAGARMGSLVPHTDVWRRYVPALVLVVVLPIAVYAGVNVARFGHPWRIPQSQQTAYLLDPVKAQQLAANGNSLFGLKFIPSNLLAYARPDGIRLAPTAGLVSFPDVRTITVLGEDEFDSFNLTASIPATMPLMLILAVAGMGTITRSEDRRRLSAVRMPLLAAALGGFVVLAFAVMAYRYVGDFMPFLVLTGSIGLVRLTELTAHWRTWTKVIAMGALSAWSVWVFVGLSLTQLMIVSPVSNEDAQRLVAATLAADRAVHRSAELPVVTALGAPRIWEIARSPNCSRVYVGTGAWWRVIEQKPGTGAYRLHVPNPPADGIVHPLVQSRDASLVIGLEHSDGRIHVRVSGNAGHTWHATWSGPKAQPPPSDAAGSLDLAVDFDFFAKVVSVVGLGDGGQTSMMIAMTTAEQPVDVVADYPGAITTLPQPTPLCDA